MGNSTIKMTCDRASASAWRPRCIQQAPLTCRLPTRYGRDITTPQFAWGVSILTALPSVQQSLLGSSEKLPVCTPWPSPYTQPISPDSPKLLIQTHRNVSPASGEEGLSLRSACESSMGRTAIFYRCLTSSGPRTERKQAPRKRHLNGIDFL